MRHGKQHATKEVSLKSIDFSAVKRGYFSTKTDVTRTVLLTSICNHTRTEI